MVPMDDLGIPKLGICVFLVVEAAGGGGWMELLSTGRLKLWFLYVPPPECLNLQIISVQFNK